MSKVALKLRSRKPKQRERKNLTLSLDFSNVQRFPISGHTIILSGGKFVILPGLRIVINMYILHT